MTLKISPELALVAACCRWPRSAERNSAIAAAAARVVDFELFYELVVRHRVTPLVQDGLSCAGIALPAPVGERLAARSAECALNGLIMARESVRLQQAFGGAGIPALILKGIPMAVLGYGGVSLKESWDIDLLTCPEMLPQAHALLQTLGYELVAPDHLTPVQFECFGRYAMEAVYLHRGSGLSVELHWRVVENKHLIPGIDVHSPSQGVSVAGAQLRTFDDDVLFTYLCVHGGRHGWARLKWLADLGAFLAARSAAEIARLYRFAGEAGGGRTAAVALLLCRRLFDAPIDPSIIAEVERDRATARLERTALQLIAEKHEPATQVIPSPRLVYSHMLLAPGAQFALEQARVIWEVPIERARFAASPLRFAFHFLRIPRLTLRIMKRLSHRLDGQLLVRGLR